MRNIFAITGLLFLFMISAVPVGAQGLAIGEWRDHLPYTKTISAVQAKEKVYCATPYCVFWVDRNDWSVNRLNKINGLSDVGVSSVSYSPEYETVVITYENSNIDIIQNNSIINLPDIKRKPILGKKTVNKAVVYGRYAYLCAGFGIVVLDLMKNEIKDTYYIGPEGTPIEVFDLTSSGDSLFAATEAGIYKASTSHPNLSNYQAWKKDLTLPHPDAKYNVIEYFKGKVLANQVGPVYSSDTLYSYSNSSWKYFDKTYSSGKYSINTTGDRTIITNDGFIDILDTNMNIVYHVFTYILGGKDFFPAPKDAFIDKDGRCWFADGNCGLIQNWDTWNYIQYLPDGPTTPGVFAMSVYDRRLVVAPGGRNSTWGNNWTPGAMYTFMNEDWSTIDKDNFPMMDSIRDIISVAVDPTDSKHVYAGSWGRGLIDIQDNVPVNIFTASNSSLRPPDNGAPWEVKAGGLRFDSDNNLWVTNSNATNVLSVRKFPSGDWKSFNIGMLTTGATGIDVGDLVIDNYDQKWMLLRGNKLLVFNNNYTIDNTNDDRAKIISGGIGSGNIPGSRVLSLAVDQEGLVWLGTDEGVAVFYTPENVFTNTNNDAQRIYVTQDGYTQYLLETEAVTAIAVDGANRKWFGTERAGVFLMSADGTKQIYHFTTENSPLLSDLISAITIDDNTGEVFFGSDKGIVSFKGSATKGGEKNENVVAYPNPVEAGYDGIIAIKGLVKDADVKITDIAGNLVYHTRAEGGQAIWNGLSMSGKRPGTGVYLVFVSNSDGAETCVTKILFKN